MTTASASPAGANATTRPFIVDCDSHIMPATDDLVPYLSQRWRRYLSTFGLRTPGELGHRAFALDGVPRGRVVTVGAPPGSDPAFFREQLLDAFDVDAPSSTR